MASGSFRFFQYQLPFRNTRRWLEVLDLTLALYQKLTTHIFFLNEKRRQVSIHPVAWSCTVPTAFEIWVLAWWGKSALSGRSDHICGAAMVGNRSPGMHHLHQHEGAPPPESDVIPKKRARKWGAEMGASQYPHSWGTKLCQFCQSTRAGFAGIHPRIFEIRCFLYISSPAAFRALMLYTSWFHYID